MGGVMGSGDGAFRQALEMIRAQGISCVVIRGGQVIHTADGRGVAPLLDLYHNGREKLQGSLVVDRVIGKAAAMILTLGEAGSVYGEVMSVPGRDYLAGRGITCQYGQIVDVIAGQDGTGMCPIEASVLDEDDPQEGLGAMTRRIAELRKAAG